MASRHLPSRRRTLVARWAGALLVAAAGAIHLYLWFDYFHRVHVVGVLFLVNAAAGLSVGVGLLVAPLSLAALAAGAYALGTLVAFAVSTRWSLFGYHERFWGGWQEAAGGVELAAIAVAMLLLLALPARERAPLRLRRPRFPQEG